ncbi:MAG: hypothetical protein Q8N17_26410 [Burkholderiaceae bacterium]|nr:hypothetical protein [Burkholderiaceae bacterium]
MSTLEQMAREAGAEFELIGDESSKVGWFFESVDARDEQTGRLIDAHPSLARFAALVRADERSKALDDAAAVCDVTPPYPFRPSIEAAHAIRALKDKPSVHVDT